jgi:hypothetical protein
MKISRTSSPQVPGSAGKAPSVSGTSGKGFASKLAAAQTKGVAKGALAAEKPAQARKNVAVSDIGADLKTGKLTPEAAIDKVIARILDQQVGRKAGAKVREKIGAALRESLTDDPLLAAKFRALTNE